MSSVSPAYSWSSTHRGDWAEKEGEGKFMWVGVNNSEALAVVLIHRAAQAARAHWSSTHRNHAVPRKSQIWRELSESVTSAAHWAGGSSAARLCGGVEWGCRVWSSTCTLAPASAPLWNWLNTVSTSVWKPFLNNSSREKGWEKSPKTPKKQYVVHSPSTEQRQEWKGSSHDHF